MTKQNAQHPEELRQYRLFGLTMLQFMSSLALFGIAATLLLKWLCN